MSISKKTRFNYVCPPSNGDYTYSGYTPRTSLSLQRALVHATSIPLTNNSNYPIQLRLAPGNPEVNDPSRFTSIPVATYSGVSNIQGNTLYMGMSTDDITVNNYMEVFTKLLPYRTSLEVSTHIFNFVYGEPAAITIGLALKYPTVGTPRYTLNNLIINIKDGDNNRVNSRPFQIVGGILTETLSAGTYKVFRCPISPLFIHIMSNNHCTFEFQDSAGVTIPWENINIAGVNPAINSIPAQTVTQTTFFQGISYGQPPIAPPLAFTVAVLPNANNFLWQRFLPDYMYKPLPTDSYAIGTVTAISNRTNAITTTFRLLCSDIAADSIANGYTLTSITANLTTILNGLSPNSKTSVVGDFAVSLQINTTSGSTAVLDFPAFTVGSLSSTVVLDATLEGLDFILLNVTYSPAIKVLPNPSFVTPFTTLANATVTSAVANIRRLNVQVKGYSNLAAPTPVNIGGLLQLTGVSG